MKECSTVYTYTFVATVACTCVNLTLSDSGSVSVLVMSATCTTRKPVVHMAVMIALIASRETGVVDTAHT